MSTFVRRKICEKINGVFNCNRIYYELEVPSKKEHLSENKFVLHWTPSKGNSAHLQSSLKALKDLQCDTELIENVHFLSAQGKEAAKVEFVLRKDPYIKTLLCEKQNVTHEFSNKHVVVEFSSPNIAKPFHVGHLRSTIIGNVLANLHDELGYKITKMNYLGDWGTQLGMLQVGVEMLDVTQTEIQLAPIETLYKAYVKANEAAKMDPNIGERARQLFSQLESENCEPSLSKQWHLYRDYTIKELQVAYERLGIKFDMYEWESQYSQKHILEILRMLEAKHLLLPEKDGRKVVEVEERRIPVVKSDGSTLYLTRDIAALIDRWKRFQFSEILYVVENGQSDHFKALFKTTSRLLDEIKENRLKHIKFGRIHGMSTRKGQAVFLKDLLDEARERMFEKQTQSPNTKASLNNKGTADILGVTAVIINDLKQRRQRDYDFNWDKALQMNGDTGIKLQYTHCRLYSLLEQNAHLIQDNVVETRFDYLNEEEAIDLLNILGRYPQVLWQTKEQLEACILVNYLFNLCNSTSRCLKRLPVKTEENILKQKQRLLLFQAAKRTLHRGMNILGLKCLNEIKLGFTKVKAPNSHNRKRLAIESRRHASPDDSHMFIIKLPPNMHYYSHPKAYAATTDSKNSLTPKTLKHAEDANGKKVSFPFSSNGRPGRIYHWNLPVLKKMLQDNKQRHPTATNTSLKKAEKLIDIKNIPTWSKPWENDSIEKSYGHDATTNYKKPLKRKSPTYYAPANAVNKNSFNKYFSGNGKPKGFYVIKENQKKPSYYKNIIV